MLNFIRDCRAIIDDNFWRRYRDLRAWVGWRREPIVVEWDIGNDGDADGFLSVF